MDDENRGKIRNRAYAQQIQDMSGLRYGKITPTDIDAFLDFGGKVFIFIETKHGDAPLPYGQRLALERLCDACQKSEINTIVLVARSDTNGDIDTAHLPVTLLRHKGVWRKPNRTLDVRSAVDSFRQWFGIKTGNPQ